MMAKTRGGLLERKRGIEMAHIHQLVKEVLKDPQPSVFATIVNVDGSAYRKEGASIIMKSDESRIGILSSGCLENDLYCRTQALFQSGHAEVYEYDLSAEDDLGWGVGIGCNGIISILVRVVDAEFRAALVQLNQHFANRNPVLYIQSMSRINQYLFIGLNGERFGNWQEEMPFSMEDIMTSMSPFAKFVERKKIGGEIYFLQLLWPQPTLYIIGAGEDARPLAGLAVNIGYAVHMLDWREGLCSPQHFPTVQSRRIGEMTDLIDQARLSELDAVVVMTHDFQRDLKIIEKLQRMDLFYLGILGAKKRTARLFSGEIPNWIHSPIGLSIGAEGPEEIAVSIVAELIATKYKGGFHEKRRNLSRRGKKSAHGRK